LSRAHAPHDEDEKGKAFAPVFARYQTDLDANADESAKLIASIDERAVKGDRAPADRERLRQLSRDRTEIESAIETTRKAHAAAVQSATTARDERCRAVIVRAIQQGKDDAAAKRGECETFGPAALDCLAIKDVNGTLGQHLNQMFKQLNGQRKE
jgi:hypothetical protein